MSLDNTEQFSFDSTGIDDASSVDYPLRAGEEVGQFESTLDLKIDEKDFIEYFQKFQADYKLFYDDVAYNLRKRRNDNFDYRFGRELKYVKLKPYNARFVDPIIYDAESYLKPIALGNLPDITVKPAQDTPQSKDTAQLLTKLVNSDLKSRERKRVLGIAFQHVPVYFTGIIKGFWNPERGKFGDYDFEVLNPEEVIFDWTARSNSPDDMSLIAHAVTYTVEEWVMRFPDKEEDFYEELKKQGIFSRNDQGLNEKTKRGMSTPVKGWEIWFHWYEKQGGKFERVDGVAWVYEELLLDRVKNPYWDWSGEKQLFTYDLPSSEKEVQQSVLSSQEVPGMQEKRVFHNHFDFPRKPFIFLGIDQWGKQPLDETSRIEQAIMLQQNVDKRGKQMTEMWDAIRGKHVWSTMGDMKKKDIEEIDINDPDQDIFVEGDVREAHGFIPSVAPSKEMLDDIIRNQDRIFEIIGVTGAVRGQQPQSDTTATQTQLSREGDFTRVDDMVDETINYASEEMANWILQFVKLFYTEPHMASIIGKDGQTLFAEINRDMIEDGMEVTITASGVDKLRARQDAFDMAKIKLTDPISFYQDIDTTDPLGRADKLMTFLMSPQLYAQKFLQTQTQDAGAVAGMSAQVGGQANGQQQATMDIAQIEQGQMPPVPQPLTPDYVQTIMQFMDSPNFQAFPPQIKSNFLMFAKQIAQAAQQGQAPQGQPAPAGAPQPGATQPPAGPTGPETGNPQPGNTARVAFTPPRVGASVGGRV